MKKRKRTVTSSNKTRKPHLVLLTTLIAFLFLMTGTGFAQSTSVEIIPAETVDGSVELTPGYISGTIDLGGQNINRVELDAESEDHFARIYKTAEGPYSMTVNVPSGSGTDYTVSGMVWMDSWTTALYFKDRNVFVEDGLTSQLDVIVDPGFVAVEIVANGCSLVKSEVDAYLNNGDDFSRADTRRGSENIFRLPVQPNKGIDVYGQVQLNNGKSVALESRIVDVYPGMDTQVTWEINCGAGLLGAIQHDVNYHMPVDYNFTYLYDQGAWMYSRYANHQGSLLFDNLAPGNWRLYTYSYWNNRNNYIAKDLTDISVAGGETVNASIDEYPGFLQGKATLTGTHTIQDTYASYVYAAGRNASYPSYRANSMARIDSSDGNFNLALLHGEWSRYISNFLFRNTAPGDDYLYSQVYMYDFAKYYTPLFINSNETITGHDISYETGSATIKYSRSDGGAFTSPYLYAKYYKYNDINRLDSYVYVYARGEASGDKVTFVGFPGTYEVEAWATVDGSMTTFGKATVEIVAGVEKVVDIGGPSLTVVSPEPGTVFTENYAVISGTATDDMGVDAVTVNGVEVQLASTGNSDDRNEVSFSIELELLEGENFIETIAYDTSANSSSDSRTVTYEVPEVPVIEEVVDTEEDVDNDSAGQSFLEIDKAYVKKDGKVKIYGRLALPVGVSPFDIDSVAAATISLSSPEVMAIDDPEIDFKENGKNDKWKYDEKTDSGIKKFKIDWYGYRFNYQDDVHQLTLKTNKIGGSKTELEITSCGSVTVDIDGVTIDIDEEDVVTVTPDQVKVHIDDECAIRVKLPFALTEDMIFDITHNTGTESVQAGDYLAAVGKFKLDGRFDSDAIDLTSMVPYLDLTVELGEERYLSTLVIDEEDWTKIKPKHWKYKHK